MQQREMTLEEHDQRIAAQEELVRQRRAEAKAFPDDVTAAATLKSAEDQLQYFKNLRESARRTSVQK